MSGHEAAEEGKKKERAAGAEVVMKAGTEK